MHRNAVRPSINYYKGDASSREVFAIETRLKHVRVMASLVCMYL